MSYNKNRKFSIGYSYKITPIEYIKLINPYRKHIHSIYVGLPELETPIVSVAKQSEVSFNGYVSKEFLKLTNGLYKRIIPYNVVRYKQSDNELFKYFDEVIYPLIEEYNIDGFILTHFDLARRIKRDFPKIEIHTSCNSFHFTISTMEQWRHAVGVTLFNPPREAARTPSLLKELYNEGFKLKVLVNEGGMYGCSYKYTGHCGNCMKYDMTNALRSNLFLPRWLDYIDEYVDVFKLSGRMETRETLRKIYDSYILQKPFEYINDIVVCKNRTNPIRVLEREHNIRIKECDISDNLATCENRNCFKGCSICETLFDYITNNNIHIKTKYDII